MKEIIVALACDTPAAGIAWKVGAAPEFAVKTYPAVPAAVVANEVVVSAYVTPYCVNALL